MRKGLRWLAPVLSVSVLVLLIARASSCSDSSTPAALVPGPDTRVAPARTDPVETEPAAATPAAIDAGRREPAPTLRAVPSPSNREFLGGSKSGVIGLDPPEQPEQVPPPGAPLPGGPGREAGE